MLRLLIFIVVIAVATSPEARAKIAPYSHWLLDPAYEWSIQSRLGQIAHSIEGAAAAGRPFPTTTAGLAAFLESDYGGAGKTVDPWGHPLYMVRDARGLHAASVGRDGTRGTHDDLLSPSITLP